MKHELSLLGFGEAGSSLAHASNWRDSARTFDIRAVDVTSAGVVRCASAAEAVAGSPVIISVVTADAAVDVARISAQSIAKDALYLDMNSVSPDSKREAEQAIVAAGGRYVDIAVMAPINPQLMAVPLLLSGQFAPDGMEALRRLGFTNVRVVGADVGRASTIKMLRSVIYKGLEALTAESLIACERAGVTDEVLASLGGDWAIQADYRLDRMLVHGVRRAAEIQQSSKTLQALGVSPNLSNGTVVWQQAIGEMAVSPLPVGLKAKLVAISGRLP